MNAPGFVFRCLLVAALAPLAGARAATLAAGVRNTFGDIPVVPGQMAFTSGLHTISLGPDTTSTHSRAGDELAGQLRDNVVRAFRSAAVRPSRGTIAAAPTASRREIAAEARPYNPAEMHESLANVVRKLDRAGYGPAFAAAFGEREITSDRVARALEQFLLTLTSHDSKFDRVLQGVATLTAEEQRGFELFHTEYDPRRGQFGADCFHCHGGPLFSDFTFHNNGLDAEGAAGDPGRFLATTNPADRAKFKTPSLRNVAVTAPYMHDGRFATLGEVVAITPPACGAARRWIRISPSIPTAACRCRRPTRARSLPSCKP